MGSPRSTCYAQHRRQVAPRLTARGGPETGNNDKQLLAEARGSVQEWPFHGEGDRKVSARLRRRYVGTLTRRSAGLM
jgi:hypothetical protein